MLRLSTAKLVLIVTLTFFISLYLVPFIAIRGCRPDLLLLFVIFYSFRVSWKQAPFVALGIGVLKDLLSLRMFGIETFALVAAGVLASFVMGVVEREESVILMTGAFLYSLFYEWVCAAEYAFVCRSFSVFSEQAVRGVWNSLYTMLLLPLLFSFFERIAAGRRSIFAGREIR